MTLHNLSNKETVIKEYYEDSSKKNNKMHEQNFMKEMGANSKDIEEVSKLPRNKSDSFLMNLGQESGFEERDRFQKINSKHV